MCIGSSGNVISAFCEPFQNYLLCFHGILGSIVSNLYLLDMIVMLIQSFLTVLWLRYDKLCLIQHFCADIIYILDTNVLNNFLLGCLYLIC